MENQPPQLTYDREVLDCHDPSFLPNKGSYPPRPSDPFYEARNDSHKMETDAGAGYKTHDGDAARYWDNSFATDPRNYQQEETYDYSSSSKFDYGIIGNVIAFILVMGLLLAFMFCQIAIFAAIGETSNWLNCLAYAFLGLPVMCIILTVLVFGVARTQGDDDLLCFPSTFKKHAGMSPVIAVVAFIFFFSCGVPLSMLAGQERALKHYLDPTMTQDISCYQNPQKNYEHGKVHFMFLQEREWEWNCSSTGLSESNHSVSTYAMRGRLGTQGNHYFYMSNLFYTGEPKWNCPYPIFAACYFNTGTVQTCEMLKNSTQCWKGPRTGVSYRVMNQNEQFFKNWMSENDSEGEDFIRTKIQRTMYNEPWRNTGPIVTYGGDHPGDFEDKLLSVRKNLQSLYICIYVLWCFFILLWCCDPEMSALIMLLVCITCNC